MALDERLRRELDGAGRPADPTGVYEELIRRRERRRMVRRVQQGALAAMVLGGSLGLIVSLSIVFRPGDGEIQPAPPGQRTNGDLAYTTGDRIVISSPDGAAVREIPAPEEGLAWHIAWSPDGTKLAVAVFQDPGRSLWVMNADGSDPVLIARTENVHRPSWHPDGHQLTYSVESRGRTEIHIGASDGSEDRIVHEEAAPGTYAIFSSTFSPDGSQILFDAGTDVEYHIFVMNSDGSNVRQLTTTGTDYNPSWSPDGSLIVFTREEGVNGGSDIFMMNADGSNVRRLTDDGPDTTNLNPQFSPDGTLITYESRRSDDAGSVMALRVDSTYGGPFVETLIDEQVLGYSWQPVPTDDGVLPSPPTDPSLLPSPTTPPEDPRITDVGLGLGLCDVSSVRGTFLGAYPDSTAFVGAEPTASGRCRSTVEMSGVIAIDLSGDGVADLASESFSCQTQCGAFAAPDVDGDGTDELLAINVGFSVVGLQLFDVVPNEDAPAIVPVMVEPPGDAALGYQGFDGSGPPQFWIGGDGFGGDALRCDTVDGRRVLVSSTAQMVPPDSPDSVWEVHETTFVLEDGVLSVIGARDYEAPDPSLFSGTGGCGARMAWP